MESSEYKTIELDNIHPCKFQLREDVMEEIKELAESIRIKGVLQPICVTPDETGYEITCLPQAGMGTQKILCLNDC